MGNLHTNAGQIEGVRMYNKCEFNPHLLPPYHREVIVREHHNMKTLLGKKNFNSNDWKMYSDHMLDFMNNLPSAPSDEDICRAVEFYRLLDRRGDLPVEFSEEDRQRILDRHQSLKDIKDLSMSLVRRDFGTLIAYREEMYATFSGAIPPTYGK